MNNPNAWFQFALYVGALLLITKPLGIYLVQVLDPRGRTWLDRVVRPFERLTYRLCGIDSAKEQNWIGYTFALLAFSLIGLLFTYFILRYQDHLPLNPQAFPGLSPHLAFNTAASFTTNTNWQSYAGESTLSYFSQMVALTIHNFTSAAAGIAIAAALVRGIARQTAQTIGNFWVDVVRVTYYLLLPVSFVFALFLVSQGMIQNFKPFTTAKTYEAYTIQVPKNDDKGQPVLAADGKTPVMVDQSVDTQTIVQGPMASQVAIKMLGTNGGGYTNANAAHPFENPTALSNFLQMLSIFAIPSALTYFLGRMVRNQRHGWAVWAAMAAMFIAGTVVCWKAESSGNPIHQKLGVAVVDGNMEGKEVRFGIAQTAIFATATTDASCGAVDAMHESFLPLGGMVPLVNIMLGEIIFGGVGSGLYGFLLFAIVAVFVAGLMVGRTPEYLGKKIEAREVKLTMLAILCLPLVMLGFTALAVVLPGPMAAISAAGPHGFTEALYAYVSGAGNNGSAFAGLSANTAFWNTTLGIDMIVGRFFVMIPALAIAGAMAAKKTVPASSGTFPTNGPLFVGLVIGVIMIVGGLTFFPSLALGPIVEHYAMTAGTLY